VAQKPISVKVSTKKVIDALEKALAERKKSIADNEKAKKEYDKAVTEFRDSLAEMFRSGKGKVTSVSKSHAYRYNEENNKYEITVEFPASVKAPKEPENLNDWSMKSDIEELENAIAVLKMTDEETINTSTYKGVARFIK
jgi:chromosome segregation ATPase